MLFRSRLRRHPRLRNLHPASDLRGWRNGERLRRRLRADHLRRPVLELWNGARRVRCDGLVWYLQRQQDLRRCQPQHLRHGYVHAHHLRRTGEDLRAHLRRLQRDAQLRELPCRADLRFQCLSMRG